MAEKPSKVSILEISQVLAKAGFALFRRAAQGPFQASQGAPSYGRDVLNSGLRVMTTDITVDQAQYAQPTTENMYKAICRAKGRRPDVVDLGNDAKGLWIGSKDAESVMLYFHGGGYVISATHGHIIYQFDLEQMARKHGHSLAIFSLSYSLAPGTMYPGQLAQAASALRYLLEEQNRNPSSIMLAGDSAGGNLVAALLLHLAEPHPSGQVPSITISCPLRAALLISPWISFSTDSQSFLSNARSDYITVEAISHAISAYVGTGHEEDPYAQPIKGSMECWTKAFDRAIDEMMIWAGGGEVLIDEISAFAGVIEKALADASSGSSLDSKQPSTKVDRSRLNFVVTEKASHEKMILDRVFLGKTKASGRVDIEKWLRTILASENA